MGMEMPKVTDAHRKLEALAGSWTCEEKMYPTEWCPEAGTATGKIDTRVALDGFAVISDYEQHRDGKVTFRGHGVYTYDANEQTYVLTWFDTMGMGAETFKGNFEGKTLILQSKSPMGHARMSYDFSENGKIHSKMEMSQDGRSWKPFFETVNTKK